MLTNLARRLVHRLGERIEHGGIDLVDGALRVRLGDRRAPPAATLRVRRARFYPRLLVRGDLGIGEAYADGDFECDDIAALGRVALQNRALVEKMRLARAIKLAYGVLASPASPAQSRERVAAHYDLGNDFFASFLDETMAYSCAYFEHDAQSLLEASRAKHALVCDKLALGPGDHLLDLGGGWGGLALHAAGEIGCRVTTVTLSRAQHQLVTDRIARAQLSERVTALHADYRALTGRYSKIASIEMLEAVGHACHALYFATCARLLEPGGRLLVQTITVPDERYERARRNAEFMKRHVFPGGCLPSIARIASVAGALELMVEQDLTAHYVPTLRAWRARFADSKSELSRRGYPERLLRTWEWYLGICEACFAERHTGDVQLLFHLR